MIVSISISDDDFYLDKMLVKEIAVYSKNTLMAKVKPTYVNLDSVYAMQFNIPIKSVEPFEPSVDYNIYFSKYDNTYEQIDTTIAFFLKPPWAGAQIEFMLAGINWESSDVPDSYFDNPDSFYEFIRHWGPDDFDIDPQSSSWVFRIRDWFFRRNVNNNSIEYLDFLQNLPTEKPLGLKSPLSPYGQDVIYQNGVLYFDMSGQVRKYDFNDNTYTYFYTKGQYDYYSIYNSPSVEHIASDNQFIYLLIERCNIMTIGHDGTFVSFFPLEDYCGPDYYKYYNIEVYNGILYIDYDEGDEKQILRYSLFENEYLTPLGAPENYSCCGLRIMFDRVYYIDWGDPGSDNKRMVSIPLKDFLDE